MGGRLGLIAGIVHDPDDGNNFEVFTKTSPYVLMAA
jgi:hypothetical protein